MLSGGMDHSILFALAGAEYRKQGKTRHTWSMDYADSSQYFRAGRFVPSEDAPYATEMAERIGSEHHIVTLDNVELADAPPRCRCSGPGFAGHPRRSARGKGQSPVGAQKQLHIQSVFHRRIL